MTTRHVSTRCPRMAEHMHAEFIDGRPVHPFPEPCDQCYSVESIVIPWEPPGKEKPLRPAPVADPSGDTEGGQA